MFSSSRLPFFSFVFFCECSSRNYKPPANPDHALMAVSANTSQFPHSQHLPNPHLFKTHKLETLSFSTSLQTPHLSSLKTQPPTVRNTSSVANSLIIYGTNSFFDPFFQISDPIRIYGSKIDLRCVNPSETAAAAQNSFGEASEVLKSKRCSVMAAFLEMQLLTYQTALTVFAPVDAAVANRTGDLSQYASLFRRH